MASSEEARIATLPGQLFFLWSNLFAFVLAFAMPLVLVRYISVLDYGLFKQTFLLVNIVVYLFPLGFSSSAYYFLARHAPHAQRKLIFNIFLVHATLGGIAFTIIQTQPSILKLIFGSSDLVAVAPAIGAVILFWSVARLGEIIPLAHGEPKIAALFITAGQASKGICFALAATQYGTIRALLLAALVQGIGQSFALFAYLLSRFPGFWKTVDLPLMKDQFAYVAPLGVAALLQIALLEIPGLFVSQRFGPQEYALYTVGFFVLPLAQACTEPINSAALRPICDLQREGNTEQIKRVVASGTRTLAFLLFPITALLIVSSNEWLRALFTDNYILSESILLLSLLVIPFRAIAVDPIIRAYSESRYFLLKSRAILVTLLILSLAMTPIAKGRTGIALIVCFFLIADRIVEIFKSARILKLTVNDLPLFRDTAFIALAAAAAAAVCLGFRDLIHFGLPIADAISQGVVFTTTYACLVIFYWLHELGRGDANVTPVRFLQWLGRRSRS